MMYHNEVLQKTRLERDMLMSDREENIIFDFIWGNTYGLFGQGYHVMIKESDTGMYLSYSVDMKYGETKLDSAAFVGFMKDMKSLGLDAWNGRTYSDSSFENEDTWRLVINSVVIITDCKGANAYPPGWKNFLDYLHVRAGIPKSVRELPPEEMKRIREEKALQYQREEKEREQERERERDRKQRQGNQRGNTSVRQKKERPDRQDRHEKRGQVEKRFQDRKEKREQHVKNTNPQAKENAPGNNRQKRFRYRKKPAKQ